MLVISQDGFFEGLVFNERDFPAGLESLVIPVNILSDDQGQLNLAGELPAESSESS